MPKVNMEKTLPLLLQERSLHPSTALIEGDKTITYAQLLYESRCMAKGLSELGVRSGDRVAIWLPNISAWLATFFACAQLGAIAVATNTRFRSGELEDIVERSGSKVLIYCPDYRYTDFSSVIDACDVRKFSQLEFVVIYGNSNTKITQENIAGKPVINYSTLAKSEPMLEIAAKPGDGCIIFTSSGTTGVPKLVLHSQKALIEHGLDVARSHSINERSVMYLAPPLCGVFGACTALSVIAAGGAMILEPNWSAERALRLIDLHGATHLNASDEAIAQLLAQTTRTPILPTIRFVPYGVFNPTLRDIVARANARGLKLVGVGGQSELQGLFSRQDENASIEDRMTMGGRPVSKATVVRARDPVTGLILPHGEAGELEFFAPNSYMIEYFGDTQATADVHTEDGWHRSGDLGYTQADGRFVFVARMGDSLRLGGFLVSPTEIESVVEECEGIDGCQVVGVETTKGLKSVGFVTLKAGAGFEEEAIIHHVATRLAKYKIPVRIFSIDSFPISEGANATKIKKVALRDIAKKRVSQ
jgi:fatty-acyl-CoA synthase